MPCHPHPCPTCDAWRAERGITPLDRRTTRGIRGERGHRIWVDEMQRMGPPPERVAEAALLDAAVRKVRLTPHLPSEPHPFGAVDFDRLVAPHLTEALELLADARLAASDACGSAARAGRLAVEAVEALVGR